MTNVATLITGDQDFWLAELPNYQQSTVKSMLSSGMDLQGAASAWMSGAVADTTAPFGVGAGAKLFFTSFLDELHDFLCVGHSYDQERERLLSDFKPGQTGIAASISVAIAPHLAAAPAFLAPAVALMLCVIAKLGLGAWCRMQSERRADSDNSSSSQNESLEEI